MYKGTTPTFTFTFEEGFHPDEAAEIIVTFASNRQTLMELEKDELTIEDDKILVYLDQAQTLSFPRGNVQVQINFAYLNGSRVATRKAEINFENNLHNEVIQT